MNFFAEKRMSRIERIESIWRKENVLLKVFCEKGNYVFKKISGNELNEIERIKLLKRTYPDLVTELRVFDEDSYVMDFICGRNFFDLQESEKVERISLCGRLLNEAWKGREAERKDIRESIWKSFEKYRKKSARFFDENELRNVDLYLFEDVPDLPSHNDLNAANVLYDGRIQLIDPSEEGYNDTARDVGRYCASVFFNQYDYFGQDKRKCLELSEVFLGNFEGEIVERARYFIGESFMSFINFDTKTSDKKVLKKLALNTFNCKKQLISALEEGLD